MATAMGPDMPTEVSPTNSFVESSSPRHIPVPIVIDNLAAFQLSDLDQQPSSRSPLPPPPNPPFVFPSRDSPSSAPPSFSRASGRRPRSAVDSQERGVGANSESEKRPLRSPALPDFSFNPGANLAPAADNAFLSPPQSPLQSPRAIPARPSGAGHKRGGSEFVGGNIRAGEAISVMGTSPTKSESGFASPKLSPLNPPPRRGHAHRRSAAISNHDLSIILKPSIPNAPARGNSAPNSPSDFDQRDYAFPDTRDIPPIPPIKTPPAIEEDMSLNTVIPPPSPAVDESIEPPKPVSRARVAFSDTLDFIPRPLSLVSSDTSSTMTMRPGHSVSGSISSIISLTSSTVADREVPSPIARSPSRTNAGLRPSTAGAVLERTQSINADEGTGNSPRRRNSIPLLMSLPAPDLTNPSTPSPSKTPKRWSFFGLEPFAGTSSPIRSRPVSPSSSETPPKSASSAASSTEHIPEVAVKAPAVNASPPKQVGRKTSKRKKKVKTWAGSILTKNSKLRRKARRAATPPPLRDVQTTEDESEDVAEPVDETVASMVLVTESGSPPERPTSWQPRHASHDDDSSFSMIDLDAALGPFNTPLPRNAEWEAAQKAGGMSKRHLHSAAGMSRFTGPGMHYSHRRAESAPEMPPFNRAGIPRFSSNSTMADVFEEDEEDNEESGEDTEKTATPGASTDASAEKDDVTFGIDIRVTDPVDLTSGMAQDVMDDATSSVGLSRRGSGLSGFSDDDRTQPSVGLKSEYSASSLHEDVIVEETADFRFPTSDYTMDSSDSATPSPRRALKGKDLMPVDVSPLHLPTPSLAPISPYSMTHSSASAFPSPRSPMSYDGNRISTAPSSITEDNFQSLLMGEPGPEVRLSSDIPSLTSSNSTMTRESALTHTAQLRGQLPLRNGERPASFTSTAFGRRRSSLASLHRLISTSHGERSKLSMEVSCENEPTKRPSMAKRLSRRMQFWKPKENSSG